MWQKLGDLGDHTIISYAPNSKLDLSMAVSLAGWTLFPGISIVSIVTSVDPKSRWLGSLFVSIELFEALGELSFSDIGGFRRC